MRHPIDPKVDCVFKVEFDDLRAEVEQARADAEQERAAKDEALAENERLKRLLAEKPEPSDPGTR